MKPLTDCSVLIVEDDFGVGLELMRALSDEGCRGVRLVRTVEGALEALSAETPDAAALDLDVQGKPATPVADALAEHNVPFVLVSGRSASAVAARHGRHALCRKPLVIGEVVSALTGELKRRAAA